MPHHFCAQTLRSTPASRVCASADKEAASCKEALAQFNKVVSGLGELIKAAQIQVSDASAADVGQYSVDTAALSTDPCKLDIVLLPFDEDKGGPEEWQHFSGLPFHKQLDIHSPDACPMPEWCGHVYAWSGSLCYWCF